MSFLEDLYEERQELARVLSNPEYSGIREIVEELYPDRAHFIFELLQNAEDAGATEVSFNLRGASLIFEHNGREFTEEDVRGITNIGRGNKKDQEDQIGRFGVGFKAVFVYTETPHIWSPTFSFKICELVLPVAIEPNPSLGRKTKFEFPFDNPKKRARDAFAEIQTGLTDLSNTTLLFLRHIRTIKWNISPHGSGCLRRVEHSQNHIEVSKQIGTRIVSAHFLQFSDSIAGLERQEASVAFELDFLPDMTAYDSRLSLSKQLKITPAKPGRVAVFFPAEKETSGLRFHLHAPFVPELSRASIKESEANEPLFKQLARLTAAALHRIRDLDLLNSGVLAVLPNPQDVIPSRYQLIRSTIINEMNDQPLTPTHSRSHAPARNLLQGKASLKALLSAEDIKFLIDRGNSQSQWAVGATQKNSDIDRFLGGLAITEWDVDHFVELLSKKLNDGRRNLQSPPWFANGPEKKFALWLAAKPVEWHQQMYALLRAELVLKSESKRKQTLTALKALRIVRLSDGHYSTGPKSFFPSEGVEKDQILPRVAAGVYSSGQNRGQQAESRKLLEEIGVREVGEKDHVQAILKQRYSNESEDPDDETYFRDLKRFISLLESDTSSVNIFADYYIFKRNDETWAKPGEAYLDSPFLETCLSAYHNVFGKNADRGPLHECYTQKLPVKKFLKFAKDVGVQSRLEIEDASCWDNSEADYLVSQAPGGWSEGYGINQDYMIPDIKKLLRRNDELLSRLMWRTACELEHTDWLKAHYRNNSNYPLREAPSQLVCILRDTRWVPLTSGSFVRPADASRDLLPEGFSFGEGYDWLKAVGFGENERKRSESYKQLQATAKRLGFGDSETLERAQRFAAIPSEDQERILAEIQRKQRQELPEQEPRDLKRRAERVAAQANGAPERITEERLCSISIAIDEVKSKAGQYLRDQYTNATGEMICQICKTVLPFKLKDGIHYFEKVEFLEELENRHYQNYLALCPNHSAMFRHAHDSRDSMKELFIDLDTSELGVVLAQQAHTVYFTTTHIADLKTVIAVDEKLTSVGVK